MSQQIIYTGALVGDGTGDKGQTPFNKVNANFTELYGPVKPTPAEIAAGVTVVNGGFAVGNLFRYGGIGDGNPASAAADTQALIWALASSNSVFVPYTGAFFGINGYVPVPLIFSSITYAPGAELRWLSTSQLPNTVVFLTGSVLAGLWLQADYFTMTGRGKFTGPGAPAPGSGAGGGGVLVPVVNEFGVFRQGTSAATPGTGIVIGEGVEVSLWGEAGVCTQYVQDMTFVRGIYHDIGYGAHIHLSPQNVRAKRNKVYGIGPGFSGNAYGFNMTHDPTGYNTDPNNVSLPRQTLNPFPIDCAVDENEIRDIPVWYAISFHGGYECSANGNRIYNCHGGIGLSGSSGPAVNYAGENNTVNGNCIYSNQINGNLTTDTHGYQAGVVVNGGSVVLHRSVEVGNNHFFGLGHASNTPSAYVVEASFCNELNEHDNHFHGCVGRHFYFNNTSGQLANNTFGSVGASAVGSYCIFVDSTSGPLSITGNIQDGVGTPCAVGLWTGGGGYVSRFTIADNDFTLCPTPYSNLNGTLTRGNSDFAPIITDATTGSHTVDVSVVGSARKFKIAATQTVAATLTSLLNPLFDGQEAIIVYSGSNTLTVNDSGNIRLQGGTAALTANSTLRLLFDGPSAKWQETGRSIGNT